MRRGNSSSFVIKMLYLLFIIVCIFLFQWADENFAGIDFNSIIFTLSMPIDNTNINYIQSFVFGVLLLSICIFAVSVLVLFILHKLYIKLYNKVIQSKVWYTVLTTVLFSIIIFADIQYDFTGWLMLRLQESDFIEVNFVNASDVNIVFPENKRNLICIYAESLETSYQDISNGGLCSQNYISELTELAHNNVSFTHSTDKLIGASVMPSCSWTMGALCAETSGLPLKIDDYSLMTDSYQSNTNTMGYYNSFLPSVITLGDILKSNGYNNYFMAGSDFEFGGRELYFTTHGEYVIYDYNWSLENKLIPSDYHVNWGWEDKVLFELAKEQLLDISSSNKPFNFSLLTCDTHMNSNHFCDLCEDDSDCYYGRVLKCQSRQISNFIDWCKEQDFYDNTVIVVIGDHCSMEPSFNISDDMSSRFVYNCFINICIEDFSNNNRLFSTLDYFPTILASLGVDIDGGRLGLGTNLFSDRKTLIEEFGRDFVVSELSKYSSFYTEDLLFNN